jgi:hypothetical protein
VLNPLDFLKEDKMMETDGSNKIDVRVIDLLSARYFQGVTSVNNNKTPPSHYYEAFRKWSEALTAIKNPSAPGAYQAVCQVIHGHTWVKAINMTNKELLKATTPGSLRAACPFLEQKLQQLLA